MSKYSISFIKYSSICVVNDIHTHMLPYNCAATTNNYCNKKWRHLAAYCTTFCDNNQLTHCTYYTSCNPLVVATPMQYNFALFITCLFKFNIFPFYCLYCFARNWLFTQWSELESVRNNMHALGNSKKDSNENWKVSEKKEMQF